METIAEISAELRQATAEARATIKDLHRAMKEQRDWLRAEIAAEVARAVAEITDDTRDAMRAQVTGVVDGIAATWREKLGL